MSNSRSLLTFLVLAIAALGWTPAATAGCGCDHPPAPWRLVAPPFASPGTLISIFADSGEFTPGREYQVEFGGGAPVAVTATETSRLRVRVPDSAGQAPGPRSLRVSGYGYDRSYARDLFTALPPAWGVPAAGGSFAIRKARLAVTDDGTLLIPLDVRLVLDATQFAFVMNSGLEFGPNDIGIFNADGIDLTLFTLEVDAVRRQWGDYYGWRVSDDTHLRGDVYDPGVLRSGSPGTLSDVLSYWRHEFHTYAAAHGPGGTHVVNPDGFHPDGTFHIDHDQLVIAIRPTRMASSSSPGGLLGAGQFEVDLAFLASPAAGPLERDAIDRSLAKALLIGQLVWRWAPERMLVRVGSF